jgi:hypothetical protein
VAAIAALGRTRISAIIVNSAPLQPNILASYRLEGGEPLLTEADSIMGIPVHRFPLLDPEAPNARHHPDLLNRAIRDVLGRLERD